MSYTRFNVSLPLVMLKEIDELCAINGMSRSEFIRAVVREYISNLDDEEENSE